MAGNSPLDQYRLLWDMLVAPQQCTSKAFWELEWEENWSGRASPPVCPLKKGFTFHICTSYKFRITFILFLRFFLLLLYAQVCVFEVWKTVFYSRNGQCTNLRSKLDPSDNKTFLEKSLTDQLTLLQPNHLCEKDLRSCSKQKTCIQCLR